ncbi:V-type ATP synthase subunit E [Schaedlerella arabinosiphila]|uniref:V-type ATP synthase subunit E n=1 Tax=Schaedlerella arabinosiphila TaxID=2044587 RepID=UPI0025580FA8|nr:V-type ATP synthase subunit E [Schaedlerella arabinosiphila]
MTLEEKLSHLQASSMEEARAEGNAIIDNYREALEKVFKDHKEEMRWQAETRIKAEQSNARHMLNQANARTQLELKRKTGKVQVELKDKIFKEAHMLVNEYMQTDEYEAYLVKSIRKATEFAPGEDMTIYINPSDEPRLSSLEKATGTRLTVSSEDFIGGTRAVIRERNILIDNSFTTLLRNEYDKFIFSGGDGIA